MTAAIHVRYLPLSRFSEVYGYSPEAVRQKIHRKQWLQGREWRYDPDGKIQIIMAGYEAWVERGEGSARADRASKLHSRSKESAAASS